MNFGNHTIWMTLSFPLCDMEAPHSFLLFKLRGALWGVNVTCPVCLVATETPNHMFFDCRCVRHRWARIQAKTRGTRFNFSNCFTFLEAILAAIARRPRCSALFFIFMETSSHLEWFLRGTDRKCPKLSSGAGLETVWMLWLSRWRMRRFGMFWMGTIWELVFSIVVPDH